MNTEKTCFRCLVSGKVQGVWFRATTKTEADKLNVTGWVRNLADGRVEALVCGQPERVKQLIQWLNRGPDLAKVEDLQAEEVAFEQHTSFEVK